MPSTLLDIGDMAIIPNISLGDGKKREGTEMERGD